MTATHIRNVAIVGATGNAGSYITRSLLATKQHTVTALTRSSSAHTFPTGVIVKPIDYSKPSTITDALRGQDALVITLGARGTPPDTEEVLIRAAADAGVSWVLPNEWSSDTDNEGFVKDIMWFQKKVATRDLIKKLGKSSFIGVSTGFWYEWSLAIPKAYGFDFAKREVLFYDDGETKVSTSTWPQVGRAVAALLTLSVEAKSGSTEASLSSYRDKLVYVSSFTISQKEMLASVLRVTSDEESDWKITNETSKNMYDMGMDSMRKGDWNGPGNFLYGRVFFPDSGGNFEDKSSNAVLGLPVEDLDEATARAIERQKSGKIY